MPITIALPLDIPEVRVLVSRLLEDDTLLIEVESTLPTARCYCCGREMDRFHGYGRIRYVCLVGLMSLISLGLLVLKLKIWGHQPIYATTPVIAIVHRQIDFVRIIVGTC